MNNLIELLPDAVANQIAAGEVVQRPASVVKELLENAVDAGGTQIKLVIQDAGKTLIQVIDNGSGMNEMDARMCFERHATSKIKKAEDIFSIYTMGFRGEAMASIAAVAQVELKTKVPENDLGTHIQIAGSKVTTQNAISWNQGTSIAVKNLFFNTPARRQFLKSDNVEYKHIIEEFFRVALAHPQIEFSLSNNQTIVYHCPKGNAKQRVLQLFGKKYDERLVPIEEETPIFKLRGFILKPQFARKTRGEQYLFVNNRFIKSSYIHHAISSGYKGLIDKSEHPSYFLFYDMPPENIDINIHPTKTEIKFRDEQAIYKLTESSVKHSLGMHNVSPSIDFDSMTEMEFTPAENSKEIVEPTITINQEYNPFKNEQQTQIKYNSPSSKEQRPSQKEKNAWQELLAIEDEFTIDPQKELAIQPSEEFDAPEQKKASENKQHFFQLMDQYMVTKIKSGLIIIDQRRAHERVLYEGYLNTLEQSQQNSQTVLFAEQVNLSGAEYSLLEPHLETINEMGFNIEKFGQNSLVFQGVPAGTQISSAQGFIDDFLESLKNSAQHKSSDVKQWLAISAAKCSSIKTGRKMSTLEMQQLTDQLFACQEPSYCPIGKPTIVTFTNNDLSKHFQ